MKKALNVALAVLMLTSTLAQAGCVTQDRGSPHPDGDPYSWSKKIITQQAPNIWEDWIWRGEWEGQVFRCPPNNGDPTCNFTWGQSKTKEYSWGVGGGISAGPGSATWFSKVFSALTFNFNVDFRRSNSTTQTFNVSATAQRGQFIEPIIVVQRRWARGYWKGGWVQTQTYLHYSRPPIQVWCYDFWGDITYGQWETNLAQQQPYRTYYIHW